jgi:glutamate dehydrogenase
LFNSWITVIPDILANAWGVMVSYFEQVQNNTNFYWSLEEVDQKLYSKITKRAESVFLVAEKYNTYLRSWAYIISLKRIFDAMKDRWERM